jgi:chromosome partitioning protein
MKIITWLCHKGGVGKTTLSFNTGAALAQRGYRVLLVDADPQGSLTHLAGFKRSGAFYDLIERDAMFGDVLVEVDSGRYCGDGSGKLLLLGGNAETDNINVQRHARRLRDKLRMLEDDLDVIVIDTNPSPSKLHVGAYLATDFLIYPTIAEDLPLIGLSDSIDFTESAQGLRVDMGYRELTVLGIVPNKIRQATALHPIYVSKMRDKWGDAVWPVINERIVWGEASAKRLPVFVYEPNGKAAMELNEIVDRMEAAING